MHIYKYILQNHKLLQCSMLQYQTEHMNIMKDKDRIENWKDNEKYLWHITFFPSSNAMS